MRKAICYFMLRMNSLAELPPGVAQKVADHLPAECVHQLLVIPPQDYPVWRSARWRILPFGWRVTPERTLALGADRLVIVEHQGEAITALALPLAALTYIELTINLLYASLRFDWQEGDTPGSILIEFHGVDEAIMRDLAGQVRRSLAVSPVVSSGLASPDWSHLPVKFRNYLRLALLPGEQIRAVVFQPALRIGGWQTWSSQVPDRAIALTDRALLVLEGEAKRTGPSYVIITRCWPLAAVNAIECQFDGEWVWLRIHPRETAALHIPLAESPQVEILGDLLAEPLPKHAGALT